MFCLYCGKKLPDDAVFCNTCGKQQHEAGNEQVSEVAVFPFPPVPGVSIGNGPVSGGSVPIAQGTPALSDSSSGSHFASSHVSARPPMPPSPPEQLSDSTPFLSHHQVGSHTNPLHDASGHHESLPISVRRPDVTNQRVSSDGFRIAGSISRRTLLMSLTGVAGIAAVGGVSLWLTHMRTAQPTSGPVSSHPSAAARPSPTARPAVTVPLMYSTDLSRWNINYDGPSSAELVSTTPAGNWTQPVATSGALRRLFGSLTFTNNLQVGVVADETAVLTGSASMNYIQLQAFFDFAGKKDFSSISPITIDGGGSEPIEFTIPYANGTQQPYAISCYTYVTHDNGNDTYLLAYYRACVRHGTARLNGVDYALAITNEENDGDYSNLDMIDITLDLNGDGRVEDDEHFRANKPFTLNGASYLVTAITPDGTSMTIEKFHG